MLKWWTNHTILSVHTELYLQQDYQVSVWWDCCLVLILIVNNLLDGRSVYTLWENDTFILTGNSLYMFVLCSRTVTSISTCAGRTTPTCLGLCTPKTLLQVSSWVLVSLRSKNHFFIYLFSDCVTFSPSDIYESFSRSLIDAIDVSGSNTVQDFKWQLTTVLSL